MDGILTAVANHSTDIQAKNICETKLEAKKELIEELKAQRKLLWMVRFDDRLRAEGVSANDYAILDVEKGTFIHATEDFKILNLNRY